MNKILIGFTLVLILIVGIIWYYFSTTNDKLIQTIKEIKIENNYYMNKIDSLSNVNWLWQDSIKIYNSYIDSIDINIKLIQYEKNKLIKDLNKFKPSKTMDEGVQLLRNNLIYEIENPDTVIIY